ASDRPPEAWMRICCSLLVALSFADTLTMPLASMSNVTSICGMPRGAGGIPIRSNWPSSLLSAAISRSPWKTRMVTAFWLSSAVENTWLFLVGIVVLRSMMRVNTPPSVSMPSDSGVTSSKSTSLTSPCSTPAWMAAPIATTSSGLTPLCGSLPNCFLTCSCTAGMRVMPPTSTTSSIWLALRPASCIARWQAPADRPVRSEVSCSSLARVGVRRDDREDALADLQDRHVERAAAEVVDRDRLFLALAVEAVGERGGGRLVDDAQGLEAGDLAGVLGRLALAVVEVGRDGDDG